VLLVVVHPCFTSANDDAYAEKILEILCCSIEIYMKLSKTSGQINITHVCIPTLLLAVSMMKSLIG
jgi:hypothetical protein